MIHLNSPIVIAIDGYSSCGKSSFAKEIAYNLQYLYIDSGAMYRAITLYSFKHHLIDNKIVSVTKLEQALPFLNLEFLYNPSISKYETYLNGENVEDKIRSMEVSNHVSEVSKLKPVRSYLVKLQQKLGENKGIVMDGRDIGTVVFPNAEIKLFMTASLNIRAQRRFKELVEQGKNPNLVEISTNLAQRDFLDLNREESPLRKAEDAIELDNSFMTPEQQMIWFKKVLEKYQ